jgi:oxygen-dependent protoporphyrinogen oxidase
MHEPIKTEVLIIGAGLTGLTTAFYLKKAGIPFRIVEKAGHVGGVIRTFREQGFVYEAGPNTGVVGNPEVAELFEELAGRCTLEIANPDAKRRLIWKGGRWHALPSGPISAVFTPLFTLKDKFRILGEPFRKKGTNPNEHLSEMVKRRLGRSFLDYAVDPFVSGVYAGDPRYLVPRYALPKLYQLEQDYGSFVRGAIQKAKQPRDERTKKATREVFSAEGGLGSLINALADSVGRENIVLNCSEITITPDNGQYTLKASMGGEPLAVTAPCVASTVGGYVFPGLYPFLTETEVAPFRDMKYAPVVQVILGFKHWRGMNLNAFGGLVPTKENKNFLGALFTSSFFKQRAPEDGALISVFMGGIKRPEIYGMSDEDLLATLEKEFVWMMGLKRGFSPDMVQIYRYKRAIPQYGEDTGIRLEMIEALQEKYPGLILAGNIRDGIGMADRIKQGRMIATQLAGVG